MIVKLVSDVFANCAGDQVLRARMLELGDVENSAFVYDILFACFASLLHLSQILELFH